MYFYTLTEHFIRNAILMLDKVPFALKTALILHDMDGFHKMLETLL